jgi:hypothetical protein
MRRWMAVCLMAVAMIALTGAAVGQDAAKPAEPRKAETPARFYRVTFTVQEMNTEGKVTNSRSYSMILRTDAGLNSIRTGARLPLTTSVDSNGKPLGWQYEDVGINIDTLNAREIGSKLSFNINASISSVVTPGDPTASKPVLRNNKWNSYVLVPLGKPAVVFESDDLDSKGSLQMVVKATPIE